MGNFFTLVVGLPFQVYLARVLGVYELGIFGLLDATVMITSGLFGFGLAQTLTKYIPHHLEKNEAHYARRLLYFSVLISLSSGLVLLLLYYLCLDIIATHWIQISKYKLQAMVMGLCIPMSGLLGLLVGGMRGFQDIRNIVISTSFVQLLVKVLITIFLFSMGWRLLGYVIAVSISLLVAILWLAMALRRKIIALPVSDNQPISNTQTDQWKSYALTMYGNSLVGLGSAQLDRFLIGGVVGPAGVGVLTVVKQLVQIPLVFLQAIAVAAGPIFARIYATGNTMELVRAFHVSTDWVTRLSFPFVIILAIYSPEILSIYGAEFSKLGHAPLLVFLIGVSVNLFSGPMGILLNMSGVERPLFKLNLSALVFRVFGLLVLIPILGINGAALSESIVILYMTGVSLWIAKRELGLYLWNRRHKKLAIPMISSLILAVLINQLYAYMSVLNLLVIAVFLVFFFHGIYLISGVDKEDKDLFEMIKMKAT